MGFNLTRIGGNLALDLANTISWRDTPGQVDHLARGEDVIAWCQEAGILTPAAARRVAAECRATPALGARILADIHCLRGAVQAIGSAVAEGADPPAEPRAALLVMLRSCLDGARLEASSTEPLRLGFSGAYAATLGPLAWAALDLFRQDLDGRLKQCPPEDCRWLFIDTTKNRSRRWCDMATCGNRAKVHRHRAR